MNARRAAIAAGAHRGFKEFMTSLLLPSDLLYYIFGIGIGIFVAVMVLNRTNQVEEAGISVALLLFPGLLGVQVIVTATWGLSTVLATEREDGTLLRAKSLPNGMLGYVVGQNVRTTLEFFFSAVLVTVAASIIIPDLWAKGAPAVFGVLGYLLLGLAAGTPLGFVIGSIFKNPRSIGGWGFLILGGILAISGLFFPLVALPGWVQVIGQIFPAYWMGLGLRSVLLPDSALAIEIGESWRTLETIGVLGGWAILGLILAPVLLRRMARRESGSSVEARRESALQRV